MNLMGSHAAESSQSKSDSGTVAPYVDPQNTFTKQSGGKYDLCEKWVP